MHHVVAQGNGRREIVLEDVDRVDLIIRLARVADSCAWDIAAHCLMSTHLHLVVRTREATLGKGMRTLLGGYARRFNERHEFEGQLWSERYHATSVNTEAHLVQSGVYVVLNPVRAGMCPRPEDWRWSSYRGTLGLDPAPEALSGRFLLLALSHDDSAARRAFKRIVEDEAAQIRSELRENPAVPG